jgi:hypothetical protein
MHYSHITRVAVVHWTFQFARSCSSLLFLDALDGCNIAASRFVHSSIVVLVVLLLQCDDGQSVLLLYDGSEEAVTLAWRMARRKLSLDLA